ncbi:MAG: flagellar hook capping FlgD N-terminal domain-containing protein [Pontibacterium sp.]
MSDVSGINSANVYEQINTENQSSSTASSSDASETSDMFMQLMIAQLENQSPTSPADTSDFMQQIANMSTVESIANLNIAVEDLNTSLMTSQAALQASSMVGQKAFISSDTATLDADGEAEFVVSLGTSTSDVRIRVYDGSGNLVDNQSFGAQIAGQQNLVWSNGSLPEGEYEILVEGLYDGSYEQLDVFVGHTVNSVTLGQNGIGMTVNTDGGSVSMDEVIQIGKA